MKICFAIAAAVLAGVSGISIATPLYAAAETSSPVATVQFADDSDAVDAKAAKILDEFAERHRTGKSQIIVKAYADRSEGAEHGPEYGRGLSHRRASEVRSYLFTRGIDVGRTEIQAFGTDKPKGTVSSANRRAEIYVIP
ncbi:OmpA family protein [Sphingopyxis sp.]|uniref:OmpA family protein n=1 Tax=Sphingopyxis sp. TaxID=1908224 RepID=UPI002B48ADCD|nr:OmpA family protein [Sphingopyxis sp.]HJS11647.1 OmpA family protein [Sphingopyxis sp.]